jgi:hypothetical protein
MVNYVRSYKTDICKKSVINRETKLYSKMPGYIKEMDNYKALKKVFELFLLYHAFFSVKELVSLWFMSNLSFNF